MSSSSVNSFPYPLAPYVPPSEIYNITAPELLPQSHSSLFSQDGHPIDILTSDEFNASLQSSRQLLPWCGTVSVAEDIDTKLLQLSPALSPNSIRDAWCPHVRGYHRLKTSSETYEKWCLGNETIKTPAAGIFGYQHNSFTPIVSAAILKKSVPTSVHPCRDRDLPEHTLDYVFMVALQLYSHVNGCWLESDNPYSLLHPRYILVLTKDDFRYEGPHKPREDDTSGGLPEPESKSVPWTSLTREKLVAAASRLSLVQLVDVILMGIYNIYDYVYTLQKDVYKHPVSRMMSRGFISMKVQDVVHRYEKVMDRRQASLDDFVVKIRPSEEKGIYFEEFKIKGVYASNVTSPPYFFASTYFLPTQPVFDFKCNNDDKRMKSLLVYQLSRYLAPRAADQLVKGYVEPTELQIRGPAARYYLFVVSKRLYWVSPRYALSSSSAVRSLPPQQSTRGRKRKPLETATAVATTNVTWTGSNHPQWIHHMNVAAIDPEAKEMIELKQLNVFDAYVHLTETVRMLEHRAWSILAVTRSYATIPECAKACIDEWNVGISNRLRQYERALKWIGRIDLSPVSQLYNRCHVGNATQVTRDFDTVIAAPSVLHTMLKEIGYSYPDSSGCHLAISMFLTSGTVKPSPFLKASIDGKEWSGYDLINRAAWDWVEHLRTPILFYMAHIKYPPMGARLQSLPGAEWISTSSSSSSSSSSIVIPTAESIMRDDARTMFSIIAKSSKRRRLASTTISPTSIADSKEIAFAVMGHWLFLERSETTPAVARARALLLPSCHTALHTLSTLPNPSLASLPSPSPSPPSLATPTPTPTFSMEYISPYQGFVQNVINNAELDPSDFQEMRKLLLLSNDARFDFKMQHQTVYDIIASDLCRLPNRALVAMRMKQYADLHLHATMTDTTVELIECKETTPLYLSRQIVSAYYHQCGLTVVSKPVITSFLVNHELPEFSSLSQ